MVSLTMASFQPTTGLNQGSNNAAGPPLRSGFRHNPMKGNIPIPELPFAEEVWLMVAVTSVRERRTKDGKPFREVNARNSTGTLPLKVWSDVLEGREDLRPGLWGVTGKLESFQDRNQFVVSEYRPITLEQYREYLGCDPLLPRAFTLDIETLALPGFREIPAG